MSKRLTPQKSRAKAKLRSTQRSTPSFGGKSRGFSMLSLASPSISRTSSSALPSMKSVSIRSFSSGAEDGEPTGPLSKRKSLPFDLRNPYAKDTPQDQDKIEAFLKPLGLDQYADKFVSFDQMLSIRTPLLKKELGMNCKERKLLRRKANEFIVSYYYTTGEVYQSKYPTRAPVAHKQYHRDLSSEDETNYVLPAKDGLYRAFLRYPGASYSENQLYQTYDDFRMVNSFNRPIGEEHLKDINKRLSVGMGALAPDIDVKQPYFLDDFLGPGEHPLGSNSQSELEDRPFTLNDFRKEGSDSDSTD